MAVVAEGARYLTLLPGVATLKPARAAEVECCLSDDSRLLPF